MDTLVSLGLDTHVFETHHAMGIAPLCYRTHEFYPDLVRQVLATAHIGYDNPSKPTFENCSFSFMAGGKFCSLSLDKLSEIYEMSDERREVAVINKFTPKTLFGTSLRTEHSHPERRTSPISETLLKG